MSEKLSALIDGELSEHEERQVLRDLMQQDRLRETWDRYHLIRAALRKDEHTMVISGLAARVREALATEVAEGSVPLPARLLRHVGTIAIAATVAAVTLVGVQQVFGPVPEQPTLAQAPSVQPARAVQTVRWEKQKPETEQRLNAYLVEHNEFAPANGVSSMLGPNVRVVAYDRNQ